MLIAHVVQVDCDTTNLGVTNLLNNERIVSIFALPKRSLHQMLRAYNSPFILRLPFWGLNLACTQCLLDISYILRCTVASF